VDLLYVEADCVFVLELFVAFWAGSGFAACGVHLSDVLHQSLSAFEGSVTIIALALWLCGTLLEKVLHLQDRARCADLGEVHLGPRSCECS